MGDAAALTNLARTVRERRLALGLTQAQLADAAGVTQTHVSDIERGRVQLPAADVRRRLARALGVRHIDILIAAGEITPEEVPDAGAAPGIGYELADMIERLPADERQSLSLVIERLLGARGRILGRLIPESVPPVGAPDRRA